MKIDMCLFGESLVSRPAGREAFLQTQAYILKNVKQNEPIILDFAGVKLFTPSWGDEFISSLKKNYSNTVEYMNTTNPSVVSSLEFV